MVVVTFKGADKLARNFKGSDEIIAKEVDMIPDELMPKGKLIKKKPILPSKEECENNSRSLSAKLRGIRRVRL